MNMLKCQNSYSNYDSTRQVIRENLVSLISFLIEYHSILSTTHVIHVSVCSYFDSSFCGHVRSQLISRDDRLVIVAVLRYWKVVWAGQQVFDMSINWSRCLARVISIHFVASHYVVLTKSYYLYYRSRCENLDENRLVWPDFFVSTVIVDVVVVKHCILSKSIPIAKICSLNLALYPHYFPNRAVLIFTLRLLSFLMRLLHDLRLLGQVDFNSPI